MFGKKKEPENAQDQIQAFGILDSLLFDKETIESLKNIINSIDPEKIKTIMECIEKDEEGWLRIRLDLRVKG